MNTDPEQRERIMDDLETGHIPSEGEIEALVYDAEMAAQAEEVLHSVGLALAERGLHAIDVTTDDDDVPRYQIVEADDADA